MIRHLPTLAVGLLLVCICAPLHAQSPTDTAKKLMVLPERPKRPDLPPSSLPLKFLRGERVAFLGNSTAERMNLFGHFETLLHTRFPDQQLIIRNFARPAEEVGVQQRSADYTALDDPQLAFGADTYFCFFGFNESYAGPAGLDAFRARYHQYLDTMAQRYPRDDTKAAPRFVLVSPIAFEDSGDPLQPAAAPINENLRLYAAAVAAVATERKLAFIDVYEASQTLLQQQPGLQYSINGCHLNDADRKSVV